MKQMIDRYPLLFRKTTQFEFPVGWNTIVDDTAKLLEREINRLEDPKGCYCKRVYKKHLELYFDMVYMSPKICEILDEAISKSRWSCELCGKRGVIRLSNGRKDVICDSCLNSVFEED